MPRKRIKVPPQRVTFLGELKKFERWCQQETARIQAIDAKARQVRGYLPPFK